MLPLCHIYLESPIIGISFSHTKKGHFPHFYVLISTAPWWIKSRYSTLDSCLCAWTPPVSVLCWISFLCCFTWVHGILSSLRYPISTYQLNQLNLSLAVVKYPHSLLSLAIWFPTGGAVWVTVFRTWDLQGRHWSGGVGLESHSLGLLPAWALYFPVMTYLSSHVSPQLQVYLDYITLNYNPDPQIEFPFFFKLLQSVTWFSIEENNTGVLFLKHQWGEDAEPPHIAT